jgi:hypothetical protein
MARIGKAGIAGHLDNFDQIEPRNPKPDRLLPVMALAQKLNVNYIRKSQIQSNPALLIGAIGYF